MSIERVIRRVAVGAGAEVAVETVAFAGPWVARAGVWRGEVGVEEDTCSREGEDGIAELRGWRCGVGDGRIGATDEDAGVDAATAAESRGGDDRRAGRC